MEEIYNNIVELNDDYISPNSDKWKNVYKNIVKYFNQNSKELVENLDKFLNCLVKDGDVYEDVVLKTALYYYLYSHSNLNIYELKDSKPVVDGVNILLRGDLSAIFENKNYKYLNKIILASLFCDLELEKKNNNLVKKIQIYTMFETIKKNYKENCYFNLYTLLEKNI